MRDPTVRIAVVCQRGPLSRSAIHAMDTIRWLRMAEGLADCGFAVDLIADGPVDLPGPRPGLGIVPWAHVDWSRYDVVQTLLHRHARCVTVLTEPSRDLWTAAVGRDVPVLLVPTGVDRDIPPPRVNPYRATGEKIVVYVGTLYAQYQRSINLAGAPRSGAGPASAWRLTRLPSSPRGTSARSRRWPMGRP